MVITGAGKAFCAGQDLGEAAGFEVGDVRAWCDGMRAMYQSVRGLMKPCVAAFNGIAAGAGIQIGLCSDLRITHAGARIGQPEVRAGLGSIVGSWMIGHAVGHAANVELSISGGLVSGTRAYELGLVNRVVAAAELAEQTRSLAARLAAGPTRALGRTKRLLNTSLSNDLANQLLAEQDSFSTCSLDADFAAGLQAFIDKQEPRFTGT